MRRGTGRRARRRTARATRWAGTRPRRRARSTRPCPFRRHQDADADRLHPRADVRDEGAGPEQREAAVPERRERRRQVHRSRPYPARRGRRMAVPHSAVDRRVRSRVVIRRGVTPPPNEHPTNGDDRWRCAGWAASRCRSPASVQQLRVADRRGRDEGGRRCRARRRHQPLRHRRHLRQRRSRRSSSAARSASRRDEAVITTKVGMGAPDGEAGGSEAYITKGCDESLARLGTDHIDLYLLHQPDPRDAHRRDAVGVRQARRRGQGPRDRLLQLLRRSSSTRPRRSPTISGSRAS